MTDMNHRATARQWASVKASAHDVVTFSCILELRDRIKALEVAQPAKSSHPAKPDSSLVKRVEDAIHRNWNESGHGFREEARAAIRAVAAWMASNPDHHFPPALVFVLEKEAER